MNVLVTGATGFTGGHLARRLVTQGDTVRAVVRDPSKAREKLGWVREVDFPSLVKMMVDNDLAIESAKIR